MHRLALATGMLLTMSGPGMAEEITVTMRSLTEMGTESTMGDLGRVTFSDAGGTVGMATDLNGLPPGGHGFHIHENGDCGPGPDPDGKTIPGGAAGAHWDPQDTGKHSGPEGAGHLGDAPLLEVAQDGTAKASLDMPRLSNLADLHGKALMIHAGGDNYSDQPAKLGGGGARVACGVIP